MTALEAELLRARARIMADIAASLHALIPRLPPGDAANDWHGPAQRAFEEALLVQLGRLRRVAASCEVASDALVGAASRLETAP
ncbi:MAG: hypothetical protein RJQ01_10515 [Microcella sp.]|uniref:hypothetical protein n=1 Tax=Microcella sp. TaxID=1913979 RepID=UPI003315CCA7